MLGPHFVVVGFSFDHCQSQIFICGENDMVSTAFEFVERAPLLARDIGARPLLHALSLNCSELSLKGVDPPFDFFVGGRGLPIGRNVDLFIVALLVVVWRIAKESFAADFCPKSIHRRIDVLIWTGGLQAEREIQAKKF